MDGPEERGDGLLVATSRRGKGVKRATLEYGALDERGALTFVLLSRTVSYSFGCRRLYPLCVTELIVSPKDTCCRSRFSPNDTC